MSIYMEDKDGRSITIYYTNKGTPGVNIIFGNKDDEITGSKKVFEHNFVSLLFNKYFEVKE